jgi:hypothetical protein
MFWYFSQQNTAHLFTALIGSYHGIVSNLKQMFIIFIAARGVRLRKVVSSDSWFPRRKFHKAAALFSFVTLSGKIDPSLWLPMASYGNLLC